ncbi:hypothetical protein E4T39_03515 [Aureobasidium subglaciale]|nr:hypothetical protein E4T39_03515 [Aureobasidium subglaciale]
MPPQAASTGGGASARWSNHRWTSKAVSTAVTKSTATIKLKPNDGDAMVVIHKELLCFFSPYYRAALKGGFSESRKASLDVEVSSKTLKAFATWLYTGDVPDEGTGTLGMYSDQLCLVDLYTFADKRDILALRRATMNQLATADMYLYNYTTVLDIITDLPDTNPLWKQTLESYISHRTPSIDENDLADCYMDAELKDTERLLPGFMCKVLRGVALRTEVNPPGCSCCSKPCTYHEHESMEEWEASMTSVLRAYKSRANSCLACGKVKGSKVPESLL